MNESEALERYKDMLDEIKQNWITNYFGGDVMEEIDPIGFRVGFSDFCDNEEIEVDDE